MNTLWSKLKSSPAVLNPHLRIADENVLEPGWSPVLFKKGENYFEIRITEQFLKDRREYWNEYNPLTVILSDFIYGKKKRSFPFVLGPDILKGLEQLKGQENVRYKNTRVSGPCPYRGDQLSLFVGLFRLKTKDWAKQAVGLLESVAKAFDSSKLSSYISVSDPIMEGLESFLGMGDQMQFRLGFRNEYEDPETSGDNQFRSGYYLMLRCDEKSVDPGMFWVKDNQLYSGPDKDNLRLYTDNDFILYEIAGSDVRNDYETFDFHSKWEDIQKIIWNTGDKEKAVDLYRQLILLLRINDDLVENHKHKLQVMYGNLFVEEWKAKEAADNPFATRLGIVPRGRLVRKSAARKINEKRGIAAFNGSLRKGSPGPLRITENFINNYLTADILKNGAGIKTADAEEIAGLLNNL
ncbi:MAG: hypothetical protein LKI53_01465 [Bacteroidales bacterium]|jgi:hypothetical protein|nr:hypothetical protein [Bacteroidales bacterium]